MTGGDPSACGFGRCRRCPRLAALLDRVRLEHPDYFAAPVPPFGDPDPRLLIVGLAPGMHGANRTGRPFTGDFAGILLYETLFRLGVASRPRSVSADDGLLLHGVRITNAVKCLPPGNRPTTDEIRSCNRYLRREIEALRPGAVVLALGGVAHRAVVRCYDGARLSAYRFAHGAEHDLPDGRRMIGSYHCSRYNTQTGRLREEMFIRVVRRALERAGLAR